MLICRVGQGISATLDLVTAGCQVPEVDDHVCLSQLQQPGHHMRLGQCSQHGTPGGRAEGSAQAPPPHHLL
jgi:hypothetical protein